MAIHGSQGILNGQRQLKPRNEYTVPRYRVTLVRENRALTPSLPLTTSVTAAAILRPLFAGLDREQFLVCGLDAKHAIIGVNIVSIGSLSLAIVHPREVFKPLILMNAAAWICAHNHPSGGDPTPSQIGLLPGAISATSTTRRDVASHDKRNCGQTQCRVNAGQSLTTTIQS